MKAVILAGGLGTRLSEETHLRPKPMVEIGGKPILWHILKHYSSYDINEFIICCGYKGYVIKEYFANYFLHTSDVTFHFDKNNEIELHHRNTEPWRITLIDTGGATQTAGRLLRIKKYLDGTAFCFTYGDGLSDVNIQDLIDYHYHQSKMATLTAVQPPGRYGALSLSGPLVQSFVEKDNTSLAWINGGFFVLEPDVLNYIESDLDSWEFDILPMLVDKSEVSAFRHHGFWQAMDTLRDKNHLETLWASSKAPWKSW